MARRLASLALAAGTAALVLAIAACGSNGDNGATLEGGTPAATGEAAAPTPDARPTGSSVDVDGVRQAVQGFYDGFNARDVQKVLSTVSARAAGSAGAEAVQTLLSAEDQSCGEGWSVSLDTVDNVRVEGERATADIRGSITCQGQTTSNTGTVHFVKEGGAWKIDEDLLPSQGGAATPAAGGETPAP